MPSTEIILTENIPGLGAEADVVKVRRGYARNYLLPQGKAYEVTKQSLRQLDALKAKRATREAGELNEAEELARRIGKLRVVFTLETGETGKAFGSITAQDLVRFGIIDGIIEEPVGGAHRDPPAAIASTGAAINEALEHLRGLDREAVRRQRRQKFLNIGRSL